ncbi:hypothetical protein CL658_05490 [bacterium]|nr:hypothetical protein [bacterium]
MEVTPEFLREVAWIKVDPASLREPDLMEVTPEPKYTQILSNFLDFISSQHKDLLKEEKIKDLISHYVSSKDAQKVIDEPLKLEPEKDHEEQEKTKVYEAKMATKLQVIFNANTEQAAQKSFKSFQESIKPFFTDILINPTILPGPWTEDAQRFFHDQSFNRTQNYLIDNSILFAVKELIDKGVDSDKKFLLDFAEQLFSTFCAIKNQRTAEKQKTQYCFNNPVIEQTFHYCVAKLSLANQHNKVKFYLNMLSHNKWIHDDNVSSIMTKLGEELIRLGK